MENFQQIIESTQLTLVDFSAEWCGPCKMLTPILKDVAQQINGKARILKVDIDQSPSASAAYQIQSVPTLILFKNGKILWRQSGLVPANHLTQIISQYAQ